VYVSSCCVQNNAYILLICLKSCRILVILGSISVQVLAHNRSAHAWGGRRMTRYITWRWRVWIRSTAYLKPIHKFIFVHKIWKIRGNWTIAAVINLCYSRSRPSHVPDIWGTMWAMRFSCECWRRFKSSGKVHYCSWTLLVYLFMRFAAISYRRFIAIRYKFKRSTHIQELLVIGRRGCVQREI
jgi:hypothetical protein